MTWLAPEWLWALLALPFLAVAAAGWLRRRGRAGAEYAEPGLIDLSLTRGRRTALIGALALGLLAVAAGIVAAARPAQDITRAEERGTVILALDVSNSMLQDDLPPDRLRAAAAAARRFAGSAPDTIAIGLVTFAERADVVVAPDVERDALRRELAELGPTREGTAIGEAIATGLESLRAAGVVAPESGEEASGRILILTDGANSVGARLALQPGPAAERARAQGVPVFSILLGDDPGHPRFGPPVEILSTVANTTGGTFTQTTTPADLREVFGDIGTTLTETRRLRELTAWCALAALVPLVAAAGLLVAAARGPARSKRPAAARRLA